MRILAFSDLHQDVAVAKALVEAAREADVLVGAGDFTVRGEGAALTLDVLRTATVPVILVSGNHDRHDELERLCADLEIGHVLHGTGVTVQGVPFFGLGGETPRRETAARSESLSDEMAERLLAGCPACGVRATHTPPLGQADLQVDGSHEGSQAILRAIEATQPLLNLCGHIHHAWGMSGQVGATRIQNLGPRLWRFDV